ncbi:MAG: hypothetical protein Q9167_005499 [Letrouitia subvulpina]
MRTLPYSSLACCFFASLAVAYPGLRFHVRSPYGDIPTAPETGGDPPPDPPGNPDVHATYSGQMGWLDCVETKENVKPSHHKAVDQAARFFCDANAKGVSESNPDIHKTIVATEFSAEEYSGTEIKDDVYDIAITSRSQDRDTQNNCLQWSYVNLELDQPIPEDNCEGVLTRAWQNCNNNGRGGNITAGCFIYSITTKY